MRIKSSLLSTVILFELYTDLSFVGAWVARGNYHNDAYPGKCMLSESVIISPGETVKSPKTCANITCLNEEGLARLTGCGAQGTPDGCKWGDHVDIHAPFQECCARHLICEGGLTEETRDYEQHTWKMYKTTGT